MKNIILLLLFTSNNVYNTFTIEKIETLEPNKELVFYKLKVPITLEIKNLSENNLVLISELKMPKEIEANKTIKYRMPKKSTLQIKNPNSAEMKIFIKYKSTKEVNYINH